MTSLTMAPLAMLENGVPGCSAQQFMYLSVSYVCFSCMERVLDTLQLRQALAMQACSSHLLSCLALGKCMYLGTTWPDQTLIVQTAGPKTGVSTVDKARKAVDSVKVILALNSISGILKVQRFQKLRHNMPLSCLPDQVSCSN